MANHGIRIGAADLKGAVAEVAGTPGAGVMLIDSATIGFSDTDVGDTHIVAVAGFNGGASNVASALGTLTAVRTSDTSGGTGGLITWTYQVAAAAVEYLARGQRRIEAFDVTIDDGHGSIVTRTIVVTITGSNDGPVVTTADLSGAVTETLGAPVSGTTLSDSGIIAFTDVDLTDQHAVRVSASPDALGRVRTVVTADTTGSGTGGQVTWTYEVAAAKAEHLAAGEERIDTFDIIVRDRNGGTNTQTVSVTVTGTNDGVVLANRDVTGRVNETTGTPVAGAQLSDTGQITFTDADISDVHTVNVVGFNAGASNVGSALGSITASLTAETVNGKGGVLTWTYTVDAGAVEYLDAGQTRVEAFDVMVDDGHGGATVKTVIVTIRGSNDNHPPVITSPAQAAAAMEIADNAPGENAATHSLAGTITFTDADPGNTHTASFVPQAGGYLGTLALGAVNQSTDSVGWSFSVADAALDHLKAGQTLVQVYDVTINDGRGGTATQIVTVTITGSIDGATIGGSATGAVTEDSTLTTGGTLTVSDVDSGESAFQTPGSLAGAYGAFAFDPTTGVWGYTLDNDAVQGLAAGTTVHDTLTVSSLDGTASQLIDVTITGSSDGATISGSATGAVTEDGTLTTGGILTVSDADSAESGFQTPASLAGAYGAFAFDPTTGVWGYTLDNDAVQELAEGEVLHDTLTVSSLDGSASQLIDVTITGSNDGALIGGTANGVLQEDVAATAGILTASGVLTIADVDAAEASFQAQAGTLGSNGYGTFTLDADGHWTYTADNNLAAIQGLAVDEHLVDSLTAVSADGTATRTVTVTINGTNDVTYQADGSVDPSATKLGAGTQIIAGSGIPASHFGLARQTDTGVELGLQIIYRQGPVVTTGDTYADGELHFTVNDGAQSTLNGSSANNAARSAWSFQYSIATGLAGESGNLDSYTFKLLYDIDPTAATSYRTLMLEPGGAGSSAHQWRDLGTGLVFIADDAGTATVTQNSENYAFSIFQSFLTAPYGTANNFDGPAQFDLVLEAHRSGQLLASNHVVVDVVEGNHAPVANPDSNGADAVIEAGISAGDPSASGNVLSNDTDVDVGSSRTVTTTGTFAGTFGTLTLNVDGSWTYTLDNGNPDADALAQGAAVQDVFAYTMSDNEGATAASTLTIDITGSNDAAVLSADVRNLEETDSAVDLSASGTLTIADVDSAATFVAQTGAAGAYGTFSIDPSGAWTYTADSAHDEFAAGQTYTDTFAVLSEDGTQTSVTIDILGTDEPNQAPVISFATPSFTSIDVPDPDPTDMWDVWTNIHGLNDDGDVVGQVDFTPGAGPADSSAFKIVDGVLTVFQVEDMWSVATAINNSGDVAGYYIGVYDYNGEFFTATHRGFTESDGELTYPIDSPFSPAYFAPYTMLLGNNDDGVVVGANADGGVIYAGGSFTGLGPVAVAIANDINNLGHVAGSLYTEDGPQNFVYRDGVLHLFGLAPGDTSGGSPERNATGINDLGHVVGTNGGTNHGYIYDGHAYTDFAIPNELAPNAELHAINNSGQVAGWYTDGFGIHGFVASLAEFGITSEDGAMLLDNVSVSDADAGSDPIALTLGVEHGALSLVSAAGLTGDLDGSDGTLSLAGSQAAINAALAGLTYTPTEDYFGTDTLTVTANDLGNNGSGGPQSAIEELGLTVLAVNDDATIGGQTDGAVTEDGTLVATGDLNATDVDNPADAWIAVGSPTASAGGYGTYTIDAAGHWSYALDNDNSGVQALDGAESLTDNFTVYSADGTAQMVSIMIDGADEPVNHAPTIAASSGNLLVNGSFEGSPGNGFYNSYFAPADADALPGWLITQDGVQLVGEPYWQASDGLNSVQMKVPGYNHHGAIEQTFATTPGILYHVDFDMTANWADGATHSIAVSADGQSGSYTANGSGNNNASMGWSPRAFSFVADGGAATLRIESTDTFLYGAVVDNFVVTAASGGAIAGSATEAADGSGDEIDNVTHQASGAIAFADIDLSDTHTVAVAPGDGGVGYRGGLTATVNEDTTGDGAGTIGWSFAVDDADLDDLAAGEVLTQSYVVTVADNHGASATQTVTITINGAHDAGGGAVVAITSIQGDTGDAGDFVTHDRSLTVSGTNSVLGAGERVQVSADGATWVDATLAQDGLRWTYQDPAVHTSAFSYEARIVDDDDNVLTTATQDIAILTNAIAIASENTGDSTDNITSDHTLAFFGYGTPNAAYSIYIDGVQNGGYVQPGGTWSFDYTGVNLSEGFHFVGFHTGIGPDASIFVLIDDDNPASAVDITSIADDTGVQGDYVTSDATLSVTGLLGGDPYAVEVSSDGGATWGAAAVHDTWWVYDDPVEHTASFDYQVRAVDIDGLVLSTDTQHVTLTGLLG